MPSHVIIRNSFYSPLPAILTDQPQGTYVRYARGRDVAWENDRIAFRVFGSEVRSKVGSGVDVWAKSVGYPILDKWYKLNDEGKNYHTDRGEGCDFYDMGKRSGCGGLAIWVDGKPYAPETFDTFRIVKNKPDEIIFELAYDTWNLPFMKLTEHRQVRMVPGTNFFRVTSMLKSDQNLELIVAIGLSTFGKSEVYQNKKRGVLSVWEPIDPSKGNLGSAVLVKPENFVGFKRFNGDEFILIKVSTNVPFIYYAGAGWDKSEFFRQKENWEKYIREEAKKVDF